MSIAADSLSICEKDSSVVSKMPRIKYDFILPMGEACFVPQSLEKLDLRFFSTPLDWAGARPFAELFEMFLGDFEGFFEKEDMEFYTQMKRKNPHFDVYINKRTQFFFPHDFPIGVPFDEAYPAVREKYMRRIARLKERMSDSRRVLILHIELPESGKPRISAERLTALSDAVAAKYPGTRADILYLAHNSTIPAKTTHYRHINERVIYAEFSNGNPELKNSIEFNYRNIVAALRYISLDRPLSHRLRHTTRKTGRKILNSLYCTTHHAGVKYHRVLGISFKARTP